MQEETIAVVRRVYEAFNGRDYEAIRALAAEDCEWRPLLLGGGDLEGTVYRGRDGLARFMRVQEETWSSVTATPVDITTRGSRALVEVSVEAVGRASGVAITQRAWTLWEIGDGKAQRGQVFVSEPDALAAFDAP
jgi:ketosteroid isomerase-like protein